jgi:photosystem II stability/assembly factor-like uncharacterized protein
MKRYGTAAMLALATLAGAALAGPGYWSGGGPFGGVVYEVIPAPGAAGGANVYAATASGLFQSVDGGLTWLSIDSGVPGSLLLSQNPNNLVLDDLVAGRIHARNRRGRVVRSTDGGASWSLSPFVPPADTYASALADVPGNSTDLYLGLARSVESPTNAVLLMKSSDGGNSFVALGGGLPQDVGWQVIAVDPANPSRVLAGVRTEAIPEPSDPSPPSIWLSEDGGQTWTGTYAAAGFGFYAGVRQIAFGGDGVVYAVLASGGQLLRSEDGGQTWSDPVMSWVQAVLPDPVNGMTVTVANAGSGAGTGGIERSTDGGVTRLPLNNGLTPNAGYTSTLTAAPVPAAVWSLARNAMHPGPGGALWAATDGSGLFRSEDDGASWQPLGEGLTSVKVRALAVHPNPSATTTTGIGRYVYAGVGDTFTSSPALFRTTNLGTTWLATNSGLRAAQIRSLAVDPTTAGLTLADVGTSHIYATGRASLLPGYRNGGLFKSTNGGVTWARIEGGLPTRTQGAETFVDLGTVRYLAMDRRSCTIPLQPVPCTSGPLQRLYATADGHISTIDGLTVRTHRIIRSDDAGANWVPIDGDLPPTEFGPTFQYGLTPLPLAISPTDPDVLYVGTFAAYRVGDDETLEDRPSGVFKSTDGGTSWQQASGGLPRHPGFSNYTLDVLAMAIHPSNPNVLWATIFDSSNFTAGDAPLYKTTDGGNSWFPSSAGLPSGIDLRAILVDRSDPDTLYVGGYFPSGDDGSGSFSNPPGIYKSTDGGATWLSISAGLRARVVLEMTMDPINSSVLHLGTDSGVWTIEQVPDEDGDGIPDDVEALAPGNGDGNGDQIPDSQQRSVGSTVILFGTQNVLAGLKEMARKQSPGGFVTSVVRPMEGVCEQAVDVEKVLAARFGRDFVPNGQFHAYPRDLSRFEVLDCQRTEVDLIYHGANFTTGKGWTFRMYGPPEPGDDSRVGWHDISPRARLVSPNTWRLNLDVNEPGSFRPSGESILFMGGPACLDTRIFEGVFEANYVRPPGC